MGHLRQRGLRAAFLRFDQFLRHIAGELDGFGNRAALSDEPLYANAVREMARTPRIDKQKLSRQGHHIPRHTFIYPTI